MGLAINRILDAASRGYADRMCCVRFDALTRNPAATIKDLYALLGWEPFEHDFDHVDQVTSEDDSVHGFEGLHTIRPRVEPVRSDWRDVLGPGRSVTQAFNHLENSYDAVHQF